MAEIYNKGGTDKTVILATRELMAQGFYAPGWKDLRIGFLLSLTEETADDTITGLTEEIGAAEGTDPGDRFRIGITDRQHGQVFLGFTNNGLGRERSMGTSKVMSSDAALGTSNANYWRVTNGAPHGNNYSLQIVDAGLVRVGGGDGSQIHFAQANIGTTGPAGYATLLMLKFTRTDATQRGKIITMACKRDTVNHSGDVLFTDTPTMALLDANLHAFPSVVQTLGPVELSAEPDSIILYWPFAQSRLRIHALGILKAS